MILWTWDLSLFLMYAFTTLNFPLNTVNTSHKFWCFCFVLFSFLLFLGLHLQRMEAPRLGVQLPHWTHSCSNTRFLNHWTRPGIELASSCILVVLVTTESQCELLLCFVSFISRSFKISIVTFSLTHSFFLRGSLISVYFQLSLCNLFLASFHRSQKRFFVWFHSLKTDYYFFGPLKCLFCRMFHVLFRRMLAECSSSKWLIVLFKYSIFSLILVWLFLPLLKTSVLVSPTIVVDCSFLQIFWDLHC